ncbi:MAG TPA: hypothetical protein VIJ44_06220, partial [Acidimicrobiia bacterium]
MRSNRASGEVEEGRESLDGGAAEAAPVEDLLARHRDRAAPAITAEADETYRAAPDTVERSGARARS